MRIFAALLITLPLMAADTVVRTGPFEVYSLAGDREAKELMNHAEQLRYTLGWQLGNQDLMPIWPVRMLLVKKKAPTQPSCTLARDAYVCSVSEPGPELTNSLVRLLIDGWVGHLPPELYRGLLQVYSTISIEGTKIALGAVPAQKDRDWARAHMISVDPSYSGKLRVLLGNLSKGVEPDVAYRNAFGEGPQQLERSVDRYLTEGKYGTITAPSRPLNAQKQLAAKEAAPEDIRVLQADLLLAAGNKAAASAAYEALLKSNPQLAAAHEGLGLLGSTGHLKDATSARGLVEYAKSAGDAETKRAALTKAAAANPRWAEPHVLLAAVETHPAQQIAELKKATQIQPGRPELWIQLAQLQESMKLFADATKSWASAERATGDPEARQRVRQSRMEGDQKRTDAALEAKAEARRQTEAEMEALRNKALLGIRAAEARANAGREQLDPSKLDVYREGPNTEKVSGTLSRVDCAGDKARLQIAKGKQLTTVIVNDPGKVAISGGGQKSLACGPQKPLRNVTVEFTPRSDLGPGISGEAVAVEFR